MDKYNWVLFSYNGNEDVARLIIGATFTQLSLFIDSGGNQDDEDQYIFSDWEDVRFVQIPNDTIGLGNSTNLVYCNGQTVRICDLPCWIVDYSEYPEGKIIRMVNPCAEIDLGAAPTFTGEHELRIAEMESEAEKEDPEFTGKNAF
jgi:hypothetical protein